MIGNTYELWCESQPEQFLRDENEIAIGQLASLAAALAKEKQPGSDQWMYRGVYIRGRHWPADERVEVLRIDRADDVRNRVLETEARLQGY